MNLRHLLASAKAEYNAMNPFDEGDHRLYAAQIAARKAGISRENISIAVKQILAAWDREIAAEIASQEAAEKAAETTLSSFPLWVSWREQDRRFAIQAFLKGKSLEEILNSLPKETPTSKEAKEILSSFGLSVEILDTFGYECMVKGFKFIARTPGQDWFSITLDGGSARELAEKILIRLNRPVEARAVAQNKSLETVQAEIAREQDISRALDLIEMAEKAGLVSRYGGHISGQATLEIEGTKVATCLYRGIVDYCEDGKYYAWGIRDEVVGWARVSTPILPSAEILSLITRADVKRATARKTWFSHVPCTEEGRTAKNKRLARREAAKRRLENLRAISKLRRAGVRERDLSSALSSPEAFYRALSLAEVRQNWRSLKRVNRSYVQITRLHPDALDLLERIDKAQQRAQSLAQARLTKESQERAALEEEAFLLQKEKEENQFSGLCNAFAKIGL